ncbi:LysM peptidoglycan-binding domain-containing protein [Flavobacterium sp.]|uniref:LysM peptidoglycan-binding domain-containing protein n=1 Tax=Flavobacterium sp. TaxID=239 RepID=UPI0026188787|nr:LysM peptidoglycan-binding domain-containing protein [Flavobacterium sp.]MDD2986471.1 LysM peptidoglycan-binding domain-containing protein [Flavobacterium sp.]
MRKFLSIAILLLAAPITFSQTTIKPGMNEINHHVASGETVLSIAQKYAVDPAEIYRANRFAIDGINEGMVLAFYAPQKGTEIEIKPEKYVTNSEPKEVVHVASSSEIKRSEMPEPEKVTNRGFHIVKPGETLYGLSKLYQVTVDDFKSTNTILMKNNLQAGQKLKIPDGILIGIPNNKVNKESIPNKVPPVTKEIATSGIIKHKVAPKETLYGLSKKYNVSVDEILSQNEKLLKNGLQIGQVITIKTN